MNKYLERIYNGIIKENPTLILVIGMCPTLAVTTSVSNGIGMGLSTMVVLVLSNLLISLLRPLISDSIRFPAFIVVIASFVTIVELVLKAYIPGLYEALGLYIPLIVVNCIIMGRAEAYASKASPLLSAFDGIGMGLGFTFALILMSSCREILGSGTWLGIKVTPSFFTPIGIFVSAPGAFIVLGSLIAVMNGLKIQNNTTKKVEGCDGDCMSCGKSGCSDRTQEQTA